MVRKGSLLYQYVKQKTKAPHKYEKYANQSNNNMFDFNQIINSKHEPFPVGNLDRVEFMKKQKENFDFTFLEKTYKKVSVNCEREINKDNLLVFKKISPLKHLGSPLAPQSMDWSVEQMYRKGFHHFEQFNKFMEKNDKDREDALKNLQSMAARVKQASGNKDNVEEMDNKNKL